jgi:hypothetical protein
MQRNNEQDLFPPKWINATAPVLGDFTPFPPYASVQEFVDERRSAGLGSPDEDPESDPVHPGQKKDRKKWNWPKHDDSTDHDDNHPDTKEMRRLSVIFEWAILRATITLNDINRALDWAEGKAGTLELEDFTPPNQPTTQSIFGTDADSFKRRYEAARNNCHSLLNDFINHGNPA